MNIAFYAPLKPPDHPTPSGDRELARALAAALRLAGHRVNLGSRLRSFDRDGNPLRQQRLQALGRQLAARTIRRLAAAPDRPDLWFTYHVHHKAPDWLGPTVCDALHIPYVIAEASTAAKQRAGCWATGHAGAAAAIVRADAIVHVNPTDVAAVRGLRGTARADVLLPPFIDVAAFVGAAPVSAARSPAADDRVRLVTVAMMRGGAKLASYRQLATALARLPAAGWELEIIGDGPARGDVAVAFAALPPSVVRFAGALDRGAIATRLAAADLFVWPAIDEAFGMALIEAQACGLPVVAGYNPGVAAVVVPDGTARLVPAGDTAAFAAAVAALLDDPDRRQAMGRAAARHIRARHDLPMAAAALDQLVRSLPPGRTADGEPR